MSVPRTGNDLARGTLASFLDGTIRAVQEDYPYDDPKRPDEPEQEKEAKEESQEPVSPLSGPHADPYGLGSTRFGLAAHVVAGLSYFFWPVLPLIIYLMEPDNRFVRFHALQSLILGLGMLVVAVVAFVLRIVPVFGALASMALWIGFAALVIWGIVSAFTGQWKRLPVVGEMAAQQLKLDG